MAERRDKSARWRWAILLTATAATAAASFYPTADNSLAKPTRTGKRAAQPTSAGEVATTTNAAQATDATDASDPFAPRGWQPPPPPPPVPVKPTVAAAPAAPPAPAGPPPLPFKFMGAMNDDGAQVIYLSRGDQAFVARSGETLDSAYKVLAVDNQHVEFEHLPTGEKQTLTIPATDN